MADNDAVGSYIMMVHILLIAEELSKALYYIFYLFIGNLIFEMLRRQTLLNTKYTRYEGPVIIYSKGATRWQNQVSKTKRFSHQNFLRHPFCMGKNNCRSLLFALCPYPMVSPLRDFPDHATFREKGTKLACADKLGVFLSLTICKKANFDPLKNSQICWHCKMRNRKKMYELFTFSGYKSVTDACMPYILKILLKIKSLLLFLANGRACLGLISMIYWSDTEETQSSHTTGLFVQLSPW